MNYKFQQPIEPMLRQTLALNRPGQIIILNGAPRSGKSSIVRAIQERFDGIWMNLGVDVYRQAAPEWLQPSIGLRPGGERTDIEVHLPVLFAALYGSVAAHSREGLNVAVDIGHHEAYSKPLHILQDSARRLAGLPVLLVGVRCSLTTILERRANPEAGRETLYENVVVEGDIPAPVLAWQRDVHSPGLYDLEVDTSVMSLEACCDRIRDVLRDGIRSPSAIQRLADLSDPHPCNVRSEGTAT